MSVEVNPAEAAATLPAELALLRQQIDQIDSELLDVLMRRFAVTNQVGLLKAQHRLNSVDPVREQEKLQRLRQLASEKGLNPEFIHGLFQHLFNEVVKNHRSFLTK
jgi:chorismate mutase